MKKVKRLTVIQEIIGKYKIGSQDELLQRLEKKGFSLTQATLSRDLKYLKVGKISDAQNEYVYVLPHNVTKTTVVDNNDFMPVANIKSIEFSHNQGVIKTAPGFANGVALKIDNLGLYEILGTIAGDDTILIIIREGFTKRDVLNVLVNKIPALKQII